MNTTDQDVTEVYKKALREAFHDESQERSFSSIDLQALERIKQGARMHWDGKAIMLKQDGAVVWRRNIDTIHGPLRRRLQPLKGHRERPITSAARTFHPTTIHKLSRMHNHESLRIDGGHTERFRGLMVLTMIHATLTILRMLTIDTSDPQAMSSAFAMFRILAICGFAISVGWLVFFYHVAKTLDNIVHRL